MLIATWNVNSISVRLEQVLDWLKKERPTLLCLQETKIPDERFPTHEFERIGYHCEIFGEKSYNGVAILSLKPPAWVKKGLTGEAEGSSKRSIEIGYEGMILLNTYIPNGQAIDSEKYLYKMNWLQSLKSHIENRLAENVPMVWCGDFNIAPEDIDIYDPVSLNGQIMCSQQERQALQRIKDIGFIDAFRIHEKNGSHYSWWDYRAQAFRRNMGFRIDHIWITSQLASKCVACWIDKDTRKLERPSDHVPIIAQFK